MAIEWSAHHRTAGYLLIVAVMAPVVGCEGGGNVNRPRGNAIGDRHADFMRVVAHARTLPAGDHSALNLPPDVQIKNLLAVHVEPGKVYALEFPSHPIDSNPIYVFVEPGISDTDPEAVARAIVAEHGSWSFRRRLDEPGWYYVAGP